MGEELAGAAHAGLDLVEDQQQPALVAERAQAPQALRRHRAQTALALDRLNHDRGRLIGDRGLERRMVAERDLVEAVDLGPEAFDVFLLAAGRDRRQRAAVEGALEGDDAVALGMALRGMVFPRHLDGGLVGLGPRIGEEDALREGRLAEAPRQLLALRHRVEVGGVPDLPGLGRQRLDQMRMGVAERIDRDARAEIEIAGAVGGDRPGALAPLEGDGRACIGRQQDGGSGGSGNGGRGHGMRSSRRRW